MEFEKRTAAETDEHAKGEARRRVKKKRGSKEKAPAPEIKKPIKAPVLAEILAEEEKKKSEEKPRATKKTKKKTGQAASAGTVTSAQKAQKETEASHTAAEPKPNQRKQETQTAGQSEQPETGSRVSREAAPETDTKSLSESEADETLFTEQDIPLHETDDEGELFVSERWQRGLTSEQPHETDEALQTRTETAPDITAETDTEDTENENQTAQTSSTASRPQTTQAQPTAATAAKSSPTGTQTRTQRPATNGTGGTAVPPLPAASFANQPPAYSPGIASPNVAPSPSLAPNLAPAAANRAPYNYRRAERRNLVAGIIPGGVIEHIRHKRRENRMKKSHEKEIKKLKNEQQFQEAEQLKEKQKAERTKTTLERQIDRLKQTVGTKTESQQPASRQETAPASSFYEDFKRKYRTASEASAQERVQQKTAGTEKPAPVPKQQPENIDEPLQVSPDRRVETSAWHRIEVDKKTGKAVENPELMYGEEFQNEQHQEQLRRQIDEASVGSEQVKQNYLPMVDKTANTVVETHDTSRNLQLPSPPKQRSTSDNINDALQNIRDRTPGGNFIDLALFGVLILVIIAILIAL